MSELYDHGNFLDKEQTPTQLPTPGQTPTKSCLGKRRNSPTTKESLPSKRVRFSQSSDEQPVFTAPTSSAKNSTSENEEEIIPKVKPLPQDRYLELLKNLTKAPIKLSLADVSGCLNTLQDLTGNLAEKWFGKTKGSLYATDRDRDTIEIENSEERRVDSDDRGEFPMHELQENYASLYYTIQNLLDASTTSGLANTGWYKFLTNPEHRQYLIYAILGEWFTQRIFKHTSFGLSPEAQDYILQEIDRKYLHHDAVIRGKKRSEAILTYWNSDDELTQGYLEQATDDFAEEILTILAPLMPTYKTTDPYGLHLTEVEKYQKGRIKFDLKQLIKHCAGLHLSMLCTGENGTVFHFVGRMENGREFPIGAPSVCVNGQMCNNMRDDNDPDEKLLIKMTCWARVEAYVFHGNDQEEMAKKQEELIAKETKAAEKRFKRKLTANEILKIEYRFDWSKHPRGRDFWAPLPRGLWADTRKRREKQEMMARSYAIRKQIDDERYAKKKQEAEPEWGLASGDRDPDWSGSNLDSHFSSSDSSSDEPDDRSCQEYSDTSGSTISGSGRRRTNSLLPKANKSAIQFPEQQLRQSLGQQEEVLRGPYVTIYHCICPHKVYCEWTKTQSRYDEGLAHLPDQSVKRKSIRQVNSLAAAVAKARSQLQGKAWHDAKYGDTMRKLWNFYADHNSTIEWGALKVATAILLYKTGHLQAFLQALLNGVVASAGLIKEIFGKLEKLLNETGHDISIEHVWQRFSEGDIVKAFRQAFDWRSLKNIPEIMGIRKLGGFDFRDMDIRHIPNAMSSRLSLLLSEGQACLLSC